MGGGGGSCTGGGFSVSVGALLTGALVGSLIIGFAVPSDSGLLNLMHAYGPPQLLLLTSAAIWSHSEGMICKQNDIDHDFF